MFMKCLLYHASHPFVKGDLLHNPVLPLDKSWTRGEDNLNSTIACVMTLAGLNWVTIAKQERSVTVLQAGLKRNELFLHITAHVIPTYGVDENLGCDCLCSSLLWSFPYVITMDSSNDLMHIYFFAHNLIAIAAIILQSLVCKIHS
jgi:hypothetical protein